MPSLPFDSSLMAWFPWVVFQFPKSILNSDKKGTIKQPYQHSLSVYQPNWTALMRLIVDLQ